jgi:hypothetical protein
MFALRRSFVGVRLIASLKPQASQSAFPTEISENSTTGSIVLFLNSYRLTIVRISQPFTNRALR